MRAGCVAGMFPAEILATLAAERVWASVLQLGVIPAAPEPAPLEVAVLRAATGLPIPDCLVLLAAGEPAADHVILTFDARLAARARELGYAVQP